jgi:hypothetical protein
MRDLFDRIGLAMRKIVARIDRPGRAGARMLRMQDAVERWVAQIDVARCHVDLGTQHPGAVGELASPHAPEQVEALGHAALAIRTVGSGLGQGAARRPHVVRRLIVHIGLALTNEVLSPFVELLEIVRGVVEVPAPVKAEPAHIALDRIDIFLLFLGRVGVVEAQVTAAAELLRDAEIETDRFGVADVQVTVWLRREPGDHAPMSSGSKVRRHDIANEIAAGFHCCRLGYNHRIQPRLPARGVALCGKFGPLRQDVRIWRDIGAVNPITRTPRVIPWSEHLMS